MPLQLPPGFPSLGEAWADPLSFHGKFYCPVISIFERHFLRLLIVDPSDDPEALPTVRFSELPGLQTSLWERGHLLENDGRLLYVVVQFEDYFEETAHIKLFEADLEREVWVKVESLGDQVLLLNAYSACSVPAADLGVPGNCVVFNYDEKELEFYNSEEEEEEGSSDLEKGGLAACPDEDKKYEDDGGRFGKMFGPIWKMVNPEAGGGDDEDRDEEDEDGGRPTWKIFNPETGGLMPAPDEVEDEEEEEDEDEDGSTRVLPPDEVEDEEEDGGPIWKMFSLETGGQVPCPVRLAAALSESTKKNIDCQWFIPMLNSLP